jgi:ubiquinone/menaquinone biosynthesis C-methylase UbiE
MPVMSRFERAFCRSAAWRSSSAAIARELRAQQLGREILEIGAGSGAVAERLLSADPELAITAMDIDPRMTAATADCLMPYPNASARIADATAMPFADNSFDSVVSCLMLHHIVDWERAIAEVARVLRHGGVFVGYDLVRTPLASMFHRLDGSPHRLIVPDDFGDQCARNRLAINLNSRLFGHVMHFVARKNTENTSNSIGSVSQTTARNQPS